MFRMLSLRLRLCSIVRCRLTCRTAVSTSLSYVNRYRREQLGTEDDGECAAMKADPNARILLFYNLKPLLIKIREYTSVTKWHSYQEILQMNVISESDRHKANVNNSVFVGLSEEGHPLFAAELTARREEMNTEEKMFEKELGGYFNTVRVPIVSEPTREWSSLVIRAYGLLTWNRRHTYSSRTGLQTESTTSGHSQKCSSTNSTYYPEVSPVVIVLPTYQDKCLLVRQPHFPPLMYSAVAGFCIIGESIEDAAKREVAEEVALCIKDIRYVGSEGWPSPVPQLMLGCIATLDTNVTPFSETVDIDTKEIETAKWFTKGEIKEVLRTPWGSLDDTRAVSIRIPPKFAVGNLLLRKWMDV
eukprot:m.137232 g.137232  ORF g.137232 m.137232 type:complete len:359 (+) comp38216_c0_seq2:1601-2677(+)